MLLKPQALHINTQYDAREYFKYNKINNFVVQKFNVVII